MKNYRKLSFNYHQIPSSVPLSTHNIMFWWKSVETSFNYHQILFLSVSLVSTRCVQTSHWRSTLVPGDQWWPRATVPLKYMYMVQIWLVLKMVHWLPKFNWFGYYHTRCDNRHTILSRWFQLDYWFFELANQIQRYLNFEYRKINSHCFSLKSRFYFFLPFENIIVKSISYEIIQNNQ